MCVFCGFNYVHYNSAIIQYMNWRWFYVWAIFSLFKWHFSLNLIQTKYILFLKSQKSRETFHFRLRKKITKKSWLKKWFKLWKPSRPASQITEIWGFKTAIVLWFVDPRILIFRGRTTDTRVALADNNVLGDLTCAQYNALFPFSRNTITSYRWFHVVLCLHLRGYVGHALRTASNCFCNSRSRVRSAPGKTSHSRRVP